MMNASGLIRGMTLPCCRLAPHCRGVVVPILGDRLPSRMAAVECVRDDEKRVARKRYHQPGSALIVIR
ncbi:hypothetical protein [Nitrincola sp. MINF-07-Sa-05]|uniref:hypothetical protein n=1 Tax=Nitrincola salilacus TaxID=3400273 RepID=UPI003917E499